MSAESTSTGANSNSLLINVKEVGTILGVSSRSVWRLLSEGKLIEPIRLGGLVRWRKEELFKWIKEGCPPPERLRRIR